MYKVEYGLSSEERSQGSANRRFSDKTPICKWTTSGPRAQPELGQLPDTRRQSSGPAVGQINFAICAGYTDLNNLLSALAKHERSSAHIQHQITLKTFGKCTPINLALDEASRQQVSVHNAKVWENCEILKDLIRATCYLARQELAFRVNNETTESSNRGNYVELLNTFAEKDERLKMHLETSSVFSGTSNRIQNDLILAVSDMVCQDI
ncbi:hypothetical protein ACEWY4_006221 [Coilia grayii]|uniref:Uncharacterized protein n=1 Tax=Coilia grayii TaxID=363190 RepID=A0ABD1KD29_9TELE